MIMEILTGSGGDSVLFARYTGGDSVLVNKKEWGGFCPGGILSYTREARIPPAGGHPVLLLPPTTTQHMYTPDIESQIPNKRQYPYQILYRSVYSKAL